MEKVRGVVVFANPWNMVDENTGKQREGVTLQYIMADNMLPVVNDDGSKGVKYCQESITSDKLPNIQSVPGIYDLEFAIKPSKGKMTLKLENLKFVSPVAVAKR